MSDLVPSPFAETKSKLWIWVALSILLHFVIVSIWLFLPEPEPRQPGERKLTIKEEQAEELQDRVEETNLKELRQKIVELQSIKATMARIREEEIARVAEFEQTMVVEAPQDIAALLMELSDIYVQIHEDYQKIESSLELYREWRPRILKAAEEDTIQGLRLLPKLQPYWDSFEGMGDRFEVAFYEIGAINKAIEVKLEWLDDPSIGESIAALEQPLEKTYSMHRKAWSEMPVSWKRERSFSFLIEDLKATIETIERFRQSEIEGKAMAAKKHAELEARIAKTEAELAQVEQSLKTEEAALKKLDKNKNRDSWNASRGAIREYSRTQRSLSNELRNLRRTLDRTQYEPDRQLARSVNTIENRFQHSLPEPPEPTIIDQAMAQQMEMVSQLNALAKSLEDTQ